MKRLLLLIFALSFVAAAQTMTGLPGLQISGSAKNLQVVNQTSKNVMFLVLRMESAGKVVFVAKNWVLDTVPPDGLPHAVMSGSPRLVDSVSIDSAAFDDGAFVGPDTTNSLSALNAHFAAIAATARLIVGGANTSAWNQLEGIRQSHDTSPEADVVGRKLAAMMLINARNKSGDAGAEAVAARILAIGSLHK